MSEMKDVTTLVWKNGLSSTCEPGSVKIRLSGDFFRNEEVVQWTEVFTKRRCEMRSEQLAGVRREPLP